MLKDMLHSKTKIVLIVETNKSFASKLHSHRQVITETSHSTGRKTHEGNE